MSLESSFARGAVSGYYDRKGQPMTLDQWTQRLTDEGMKGKHVAQEYVGDYWVSTTWLGLDHSFGDGPPLIFETMVFPATDGKVTDWGDLYCDRYSTEDEALAGHKKAVAGVRDGSLFAGNSTSTHHDEGGTA